MSLVYLFIGKQGAGKSFIAEEMVRIEPDVHVIRIGRFLRAKYGAQAFIKSEQVSAPASMDEQVLDMLAKFLISCTGPLSVVDSFPRNERQLRWLRDYLVWNKDHDFLFCHVHAPLRVRFFRHLQRDGVSIKGLHYFIKRELQDRKIMYRTLTHYDKTFIHTLHVHN